MAKKKTDPYPEHVYIVYDGEEDDPESDLYMVVDADPNGHAEKDKTIRAAEYRLVRTINVVNSTTVQEGEA